ncbi:MULTISPECIES: PTS sugar transporter subunit IIB [unclassified Peribacillus]|uniref:PTS sugar transporter subunit IIB n=1 Tax=unclassified Peribacillus TaxID=2675266 RepID=UPI001F4E4A0C|nr:MULTISPECIES: PTS sugar transporter subunit IIB [unclassified Peribacillus]MCK1986041.1 PTS sugar transporter subunit IIB [Peribacillus sp. Aquil_B1]MCK2011339.1 PTS sugar transporter subunit IIB [Peribacillus sp. Aquil_B8]
MIRLLRVDHRLLHGQVAVSWSQNLDIDAILIANDDVPMDELRKTTIKLAKPQGIKLVVKTIDDAIASIRSGATDSYKLFIVVEKIEDAYKLAKNCPEINHINLGGTKRKEGTRSISNTVNVSNPQEKMLKELIDDDVEVEIRIVPGDKKVPASKVLK